MSILTVQILAIAILSALATVLPGIFLVLNRAALMSDAISHAILPGIVIMFLCIGNLESPLLLAGAAIAGILTVAATQGIINSERLKKDAAIGLVFPLFFSIGVMLINKYARHVHLDTDMVLLGEMAFAPFHRLIIGNLDLGPYSMWLLGSLIVLNAGILYLYYKELCLSIFDKDTAHLMGFKPRLLYYLLMTITSITTVGAFDSVGSLVVVSLMIAPAASAQLLCISMNSMIRTAIYLSILGSVSGYMFAAICDLSIAGAIAGMNGLIFFIVFCYTAAIRNRRHRYL